MHYKSGPVRLSRIVTSEDAFRITTTRNDVDLLAAAITECGLINPPILLPTVNRRYVVVCGFRRIAACRYLGWEHVDARFLAAGTPRIQCALAAIVDNCSQRELNLIETARALKLLSANLSDDKDVAALAARAGLAVAAAILPKIRSLCDLPDFLQQGLIDGTLSLPMAERLRHLPAEDVQEVYDLFCELRAGLNVQREILDNALESARREGVQTRDILRSEGLLRLRKDAEIDRGRKTALIRKKLKARRYPALAAAEEAFSRRSSALGLRGDMKLVPPAGFEGTDYSLTLRFRSLDQLKDQKAAIDRLIDGGILKEILCPTWQSPE